MSPEPLDVLTEVLALPTAPFREQRVIEYVRKWADRAGADIQADAAGNLLIRVGPAPRWTKTPRPTWLFAAHMDHPGFVVTRRQGRSVWAEFRGGVRREFFLGQRVRLIGAEGWDIPAVVQTCRKAGRRGFFACRLGTETPASSVRPGDIGMWDVGPVHSDGQVVSARACDDLAGVAGVLCALARLQRCGEDLPAPVWGLLTRGEEAGFVGALAACRDKSIPAGALVVAIETSKAQPGAQLGDGVVVRVGDRSRIFDPSLTEAVWRTAQGLGRRDRHFSAVRMLMPGGTCESSAYSVLGWQATGLCLPLDNYHNMDTQAQTIAPERIHTADFTSLVKLLVELGGSEPDAGRADAEFVERLDGILKDRRELLDG